MDYTPSLEVITLVAVLLTLLSWLLMRKRPRRSGVHHRRNDDDTLAAWPPQATRVMTQSEVVAFELLVRAMPGCTVLAQVPLSRFIRVARQPDAAEWYQRVGSLNADLLLCGPDSRVLAVIDVRAVEETEHARRRHDRMERVLKAAGIQMYTWREGSLPDKQQVRNVLAPLARRALAGAAPGPRSSHSGPLIPVGEMAEILAEGDQAADMGEAFHDPVASGFFDDLDLVPSTPTRRTA